MKMNTVERKKRMIGERPVRRATNISLDAAVLDEARALKINLSRACEAGLQAQISQLRRGAWLAENRQALDASNAYIDSQGLPLVDFRLF